VGYVVKICINHKEHKEGTKHTIFKKSSFFVSFAQTFVGIVVKILRETLWHKYYTIHSKERMRILIAHLWCFIVPFFIIQCFALNLQITAPLGLSTGQRLLIDIILIAKGK
jgi:uncharacterized membrane protein